MKFFKLFLLFFVFAGFSGLAASQARATTWDLTTSNVGLGVTGTFATVNISVSGTTATFTIDANQALPGTGTNFGIDKFFFNTTLSTITAAEISLPTGWSVTVNPNNSASGFGSFDFENSGTGNSRQAPLVFTITDSNITSALNFYEANSDGSHFVAHIAGFPPLRGRTSAYFSDGGSNPVPEPGALLLLGTGVMILAIYTKRRSNKT